MERTILHVDMNNFYASCECMENPDLKNVPVCVCGDIEERHGIVLAKNQLAKKYDIKTGEVVWKAKQKCPGLVTVPPHFDLYLKYSNLAREIYSYYTDKVEAFGIDECWLDVSHCTDKNYTGVDIANEIREKTKDMLGLTVSVGVSYNKVFAKLGSDMKKPDAVTHIPKETFKEQIWPLPASDLLFVGRKTAEKLHYYGINTIGRLAITGENLLKSNFGINGLRLKAYANGLDESPVCDKDFSPPVKSIGHGMTFLEDLFENEEAQKMIYRLSLCFSKKLRDTGKKAKGVSVTVRDNTLYFKEWQTRLPYPTSSPRIISDCAYELFRKEYKWEKPIRNITVRVIDLIDENESFQVDLFNDYSKIHKDETLDETVDNLKERFGKYSIRPCSLLNLVKYPEESQYKKVTPPGCNI